MDFMNLPNHALGDCFSPYNDFFNLNTFRQCTSGIMHPGGKSMYTSSDNSPCRKAFFTSNCCNGQSRFAAKDNKTQTVLILATGENVSI